MQQLALEWVSIYIGDALLKTLTIHQHLNPWSFTNSCVPRTSARREQDLDLGNIANTWSSDDSTEIEAMTTKKVAYQEQEKQFH